VKLWVRLSLAMALLAVAPVVTVTWSAVDVAGSGAEEASQDSLRAEARLRAEMVSTWLGHQSRLVGNWPQLLGGNRMLELSPEAQARFPVAVYRGTPGATVVALVDGTGALVAPPVPPDAVERARALVDRVQLSAVATDAERVHVGEPWFPAGVSGLGAVPSVPLAVLAAGAESADERRILAVEVAVTLDPTVFPVGDPSHGVALLDHRGVPLLGGGGLVDPERLRSLAGTRQAADFRYVLDGEEVRGALEPVEGTAGWAVVVVEPAAVVLAPSREIRQRILPAVALSGAAAVLLALLVAQTLSRPVERLRDAAQQVAEGRLGVRANVARSDEIGELARTFDHMSERLRANRDEIETQRQEIEAFNRELVARVEERTRELRAAQEELVRAGQLAAVAELGAGLAHELNNPLSAVLGWTQLLRAERPDLPALADLEREAERCRDVVAALQRVQQAAADPVQPPLCEADQVLGAVRDLASASFRQRGVGLVVGTGAGTVRADPVDAARVLAQLLNALRAGLDAGATVRVECRPDGDETVFSLIADRAVGEHPERRDDWMASGHGRWVARQLLQRLGGRLTEEGTTWSVRFPGGPRPSTPLHRG
jgi:two-component system NtrC family sensor kinase